MQRVLELPQRSGLRLAAVAGVQEMPRARSIYRVPTACMVVEVVAQVMTAQATQPATKVAIAFMAAVAVVARQTRRQAATVALP